MAKEGLKSGLTPSGSVTDISLKDMEVTRDTLEKIVYLCTEKNIDYSQMFQTYKDVCRIIDIVNKERATEEFNEGWKKIMSERYYKILKQMNTLTPEQLDCIRQATQALEKLNKLASEDRLTPEEFTEGANKTQEGLICRVYNLTPEEVYMVVTCNGQREMTLERFKDALARLSPSQRNTNRRCSRCNGIVYNEIDAVCEYCIAKIVG